MGYGFALRGISLFHCNTAPSEVRIPYEKPICRKSEKCKDCPYPAHGFVCWRDEKNCLRTEVETIHQRGKEKRNYERSIE